MTDAYDFAGKVSCLLKAAIAHVDDCIQKKKINSYADPLPEELQAAVESLRDAAFRCAIETWEREVNEGRAKLSIAAGPPPEITP